MNQQQGGSLQDEELPRISTGSGGLDDILGGGVDPLRMYLYEGRPGSGKTTLALQFLREGVRNGERVLYITLSETESELRLVAKRHGWTLDGIAVFELVPPETTLDPSQELTVLHPAEMELSETIRLIFEQVEVLNPSRIVVDSLSELRLLAQSPLRYRRQVLALKHFFSGRRVHRRAARRSDLAPERPAAPFHRPRRRSSGAISDRLRLGTPPHACRQDAGHSIQGRLPRLHHRSGEGWRSFLGLSPRSITRSSMAI